MRFSSLSFAGLLLGVVCLLAWLPADADAGARMRVRTSTQTSFSSAGCNGCATATTSTTLRATMRTDGCAGGVCSTIPFASAGFPGATGIVIDSPPTALVDDAADALAEVNAARAARGLKPYVKCPQLTLGAINVARFRAARLREGHTSNDFAGLPAGTTAKAAGCGKEHPGFGFLACCMYDNNVYAGAAKARGSDGRFYFQVFVR